jgi:ATP-dependent DNA ligase
MAGAASFTRAAAVRLYSKRGNDLGCRFPELVHSVSSLPIDNVILDGDITALNSGGLSVHVSTFFRLGRIHHGNGSG